jgi:Na+/H+ antiporter NhaC
MVTPSVISLIPPAVVMVLAVWLKRPILSLVIGSVVGLLMLSPLEVLNNFADISVKVMQDETIGWLILVCGGIGSLIGLLIHTGGALAFGRWASKVAKGPRSAMVMTSVMGVIIFIDDYLNALSVGESMKRVCDRYKVSRQMLSYIVDSTAAPVCVIIPISTWAIFFGGLLENNQVAPVGKGIEVYISAIPYMFYPWVALIMVMLVSLRIVPAIGPMRRAELAAREGSPYKDAPHVEPVTGDQFAMDSIEQEFAEGDKHGKLHNFMVPMLLLVVFTIYFDVNVWKGLLLTLVFTLPFYGLQRLMKLPEMMDSMMNGFKTMMPAISTVIAAFVFKEVCDRLLLPRFVMESLTPLMTPALLPAVVFVAMAILAFTTGSSWGIFAVSIPIIMPLAQSVGASVPMVVGALLSASSFGSQACFYSDSTVLSAQGSGCSLMSHALTQLPYALISAGVALTGYLLYAIL